MYPIRTLTKAASSLVGRHSYWALRPSRYLWYHQQVQLFHARTTITQLDPQKSVNFDEKGLAEWECRICFVRGKERNQSYFSPVSIGIFFRAVVVDAFLSTPWILM
jgi:hypothetical protein